MKILVCVTGAVASVVMPSYIYQIKKNLKAEVRVALTKHAKKFVTPYALELHSGNSVFDDDFQIMPGILVPHIKLSQDIDLLLVMPASANIMAKVANGICDDLVSTIILASKCPIMFVPSMNEKMWYDKAFQNNLVKINELGYLVVEPVKGLEIQNFDDTYGVMPSISQIIGLIKKIFIEKLKMN